MWRLTVRSNNRGPQRWRLKRWLLQGNLRMRWLPVRHSNWRPQRRKLSTHRPHGIQRTSRTASIIAGNTSVLSQKKMRRLSSRARVDVPTGLGHRPRLHNRTLPAIQW